MSFLAKTTHAFRINRGFLTEIACELPSFNQIQSGRPSFVVVHLPTAQCVVRVTSFPCHYWSSLFQSTEGVVL